MKTFVKIALCLVFLGFVYMFWTKLPHVRPSPANEAKVTNSPSELHDFEIYVKENKIYAPDGQEIVFHGVTSDYFRYAPGQTTTKNIENLILRLEQVKSWGANCIQLYINTDYFDQNYPKNQAYLNEMQTVINWGDKNGIWIIINPVNDIPWNTDGTAVKTADGLSTRDYIPYLLSHLASNFGKSKNVMFGIEAEPKFIDNFESVYQRIDAIRAHSQNPIIVPVVNFQGKIDMSEAILRKQLVNIIADLHFYYGRNIKYAKDKPIPPMTKFINGDVLKLYPVVFGEFGGFWEEDFNSADDIRYMTKVGELAKTNGLSFLAYSLDNPIMPIFEYDGSLNKRGEAVRELIQQK